MSGYQIRELTRFYRFGFDIELDNDELLASEPGKLRREQVECGWLFEVGDTELDRVVMEKKGHCCDNLVGYDTGG